ncbi:cytidylyltransferase domain-containing protein [Sulfurimonas sp.]|uniref:cytidylyltransferase domain-containing protein n=1 Tax=Sulfurimonas sp. TaxID=2022749 RepID=UPI00356916F4
MKTVIILQARMNSSRLPGKILMNLNGKTVLERVIERLKTFSKADDLIVATTNTSNDDSTCELLEKIGVKYFRGSEDNVLERYYLCAKENDATQIIRATADDPLTDISLLDKMFTTHLYLECDYTFTSGYPIGVQEEIVTFNALKKCYKNSTKENHFEHVLEYIFENKSDFNINEVIAPKELNREDVRVTLDTKEDFEIIKKYYSKYNYLELESEEIIKIWDEINA